MGGIFLCNTRMIFFAICIDWTSIKNVILSAAMGLSSKEDTFRRAFSRRTNKQDDVELSMVLDAGKRNERGIMPNKTKVTIIFKMTVTWLSSRTFETRNSYRGIVFRSWMDGGIFIIPPMNEISAPSMEIYGPILTEVMISSDPRMTVPTMVMVLKVM